LGSSACPFNTLYWHFHYRNRRFLEGNPRLKLVYKNIDRMEEDERQELLRQAEYYLERIEKL